MGLVYNAITPSGTNTVQGPGQLPLRSASRWRVPVLLPGRAQRRDQAADRREHLHRRPGRPDREGQDALLRRLRAAPSATCRAARHHHHAGQRGGARPAPHRAYHAARPDAEFASARSTTSSTTPTACRCATSSSTTSSPTTSAAASLGASARTDFIDRQHSTAAQLVSTIGAEHAERAARAVRARAPQARERGRRPAPVRPSTSQRRAIRRPDRRTWPDAGFGFTQDVAR